MAEADAATISAGTPADVLMDRAGRAVARVVLELSPARYGARVAVVCGKGNNGGDGFVVARILSTEGIAVDCLLAGEWVPEGASAHHHQRLLRTNVRVRAFDADALRDADVVVDALFGTGFRGAVEGDLAKVIDAINECDAPVVAIDIPSGVDGATGAVEGAAVRATRTVAIAAEKLGTALAPGAAYAGPVDVVDIGIDVPSAEAHLVEGADAASLLPRRKPEGHKRSNGSVAVLAGSVGMSGAAILCASGAARAGAGYVTLGTTLDVARAADVALPEVLKRELWDGNGMTTVSLSRFADVLERADSLALGPGLRDREGQQKLVANVLRTVDLPLVLDADGLNVLAGETEWLRDRSAPTIITPHPGELARLLDVSAADIGRDRLGFARRGAREFGCAVLLKGFRTVVAAPEGRAVIVPVGGPELATAGTGDVLCGVVATFLAQGLEPFDAAWVGAFVHGLAGSIAGRGSGGLGVIASDVAAALPEALSTLLATPL